MHITEIKKILLKRGFYVSRLRKKKFDKELKSIYLTFLSGLFIIGFSFILPSI